MASVATINKDARNEDVGYTFVTAAKLNSLISRALRENRIICLPSIEVVDTRNVQTGGGIETLATVKVEIALQDVDSDESFKICGVGSGIDKGDKSVAKAQTMAMKYAWKMAFVIAEDDKCDPDDNRNTNAYKSATTDKTSTSTANVFRFKK